MDANRRDFLKKSVIGGVALATVPTLLSKLPQVAHAAGAPNFHFVVQSRHLTEGGFPKDFVGLSGDGSVTPSNVEGGGLFTHWRIASSLSTKPYPIIGAGTWKATGLNSFTTIGSYGTLAAGVLDMNVDLVRDIPSKAVIPATMKMVCNIGAVPLVNDSLDEGVTLDIPAIPLEFEPFGLGVTVFGIDVVTEG